MAAKAEELFTFDLPSGEDPVVIVGTGPVGMHAANEIIRRDKRRNLVMFGNEPWEPYNRVKLSSLLAGDISIPDLRLSLEAFHRDVVRQFHNCKIVSIDRQKRIVTDANGREQAYSRLILATGSNPHIPTIPGTYLNGVYTFRDMNDAQRLMARRVRSRRTIVLGGGLLGIETARAMQKNSTEVVIVEHGSHLMQKQLDEAAAELLREHLLSMGIQVILSDGIKSINADDNSSVNSIRLHRGRVINCDTVVIATGIRPNISLARTCGLHVGNGIKVNDAMQTSDPMIYAVGECAEHRGKIYGLVAPGLDQASVAVENILAGDANYLGSTNAVNLKVIDKQVFSDGINCDDAEPHMDKSYEYQDRQQGIYRKVVIRNRKLTGCVAIGPWIESGRIHEVITYKRNIWPWQVWRFRKTGLLWENDPDKSVTNWPENSIVCNCKGVSCGRLRQAATTCQTFEDISQQTGASTVCGSCKPLVSQFIGQDITAEPLKNQKSLLGLAILGLALGLLFLVSPPYPYSTSVESFRLDTLWIDGLWKQISGFTLLGLCVAGLSVSLRKRIKKVSKGDFTSWRLFHVLAGVITLVVLLFHTGLNLGNNLNFLLLGNFILLALAGVVAAVFVTQEQKIGPYRAKKIRNRLNLTHIILFWPVPVLLGFHITSVYYF